MPYNIYPELVMCIMHYTVYFEFSDTWPLSWRIVILVLGCIWCIALSAKVSKINHLIELLAKNNDPIVNAIEELREEVNYLNGRSN